ncbi:hypothetical protein ACIA5G_39250 [Amycolatopsis sp. NPDC051758]|uniref:effector-associated constant component EACC1 n=1 Tax=Amycolatopsis sp. NPDC051758 TaxID=3363935 RepID=UPI0037A354F5
MELSISTAEDQLALESFHRWLRDDVDIARAAAISRVSTPDDGHMGAVEVICMTLSTSTGLANLAIAYANWRKARKDPPTLTFTVTGPLTEELRKTLEILNHPEEETDLR